MDFDFSKQPGKILNKQKYIYKEPLISVIIPFYNDDKYIDQAVNCVLNQTFPCFEILIIDDGSKDEKSLKKLEEIKKLDERIKVFHKENEGLAATRDYGAKKACKTSKYLFFLDSDDLIEKTYFECAFFTLEINKKATWAYTDSVGFDANEYLWNKWFTTKKMKNENILVSTAMIRKEDFFEVGGYGVKEKSFFEDWNFWLKLLAKGKYPVRMNFYGFWYRRKANSGELNKAKQNKKRAMEIINNTAATVKEEVDAIQYPRFEYNWEILKENFDNKIEVKKEKNNKINILIIVPWMLLGGADKFNLDLIEKLDKNKYEITVISTEPAINTMRQKIEDFATVYDLTTFLDHEYWLAFINYIIDKNNINLILNTNSEIGYAMLPYIKAKHSNIPIIDYIHMEEWYNRNGGYSRDSSGVASIIDKTLTCNKNSEKILEEHFNRNKDELQTVYIGVDENKFNPELYNAEELEKKYNINKKYVIGFICRITEQKRPFLLLEIIKKLRTQKDDFVFLIAGDGNLLSKLKRKIKNEKLEDCVKFIGKVEQTEEFYSACDITLNCSIKEGVALTSYESLSMGVPVISSDVGGQKELINEDVGVVVPCLQKEEDILEFEYEDDEIQNYVDAINKIIKNLDKYKQNCRKRILEGFTISHMVKNMSQILEDTQSKPNQQKIENGQALAKNIEITKELLTKSLIALNIKYTWECEEYNNVYYSKEMHNNISQFGEKMWKYSWYRGLIKLLQKLGIIGFLKKKMKI